MYSNKNFQWDAQEVNFDEESIHKFEPNFTVTQVKLSKQNTLNHTKLDILPKIELNKPVNITQNNIIYINNIETKSSNKKASIIINNIFTESPNRIDKPDSLSQKNQGINGPKSIFREKSPLMFTNSKKVSFSTEIITVYKKNERDLGGKKTISRFAKNNQKKGCKGCGWF